MTGHRSPTKRSGRPPTVPATRAPGGRYGLRSSAVLVELDAEPRAVRDRQLAVDDRLRAELEAAAERRPCLRQRRRVLDRVGWPARSRRGAGWPPARPARHTREEPRGRRTPPRRRPSRGPQSARRTWTRRAAAPAAARAAWHRSPRRRRRGARRRRSAPATPRPAPRCRRARPAAAAPRTTSRRASCSRRASSTAVGSVKISLPSTISSTPGSSKARSDASVSRSLRHSGPTRTLTFVTPWASSGSSSSRWNAAGPSSRNTLEAYTSTSSRTLPSRAETDRPALRPSTSHSANSTALRAWAAIHDSPRRRRVCRRSRSASGSTAPTGCPMSSGANTSSTTCPTTDAYEQP